MLSVPYLDKYLIGICFSLLLNSLLRYDKKWPFSKLQERLADFSFTTYLIHFPLLVISVSVLNQCFDIGLRMSFSYGNLLLLIGMIASILLASWIFAQATEVRTPIFRKLIYRIFGCASRIA